MALYAPSPYEEQYKKIEQGNTTPVQAAPSTQYPEQTQKWDADPRPLGPAADKRYGVLKLEEPITEDSVPADYDSNMQGGKLILPPVDSKVDPAGAVQTQTAVSTGHAKLREPPKAPKMGEVQQKAFEEQGKQITFSQLPKQAWHDDKAVRMGLMTFGLNLLSNNNWAESFNSAAGAYQEAEGRMNREHWAADLRAAGYNDMEIQRYIETGDDKVLTDPMERKMKEQQYRMGSAQLAKAEYETSPEYMAYQQGRQEWEDEMKIRGVENQEAFQQAQLAQGQQRINMEREKMVAAAKGQSTKFSGEKSKAEQHYYRAQNGQKTYNSVLLANQGKDPMSSSIPLAGPLAIGKVIDSVQSGKETDIAAARLYAPELVDQLLAEKEWLAPVMRKDSGAAISESEWSNMSKIYFARPGDSQERIAQKNQAREIMTMSMDPNASDELREATHLYNTGRLEHLRLVNGRAAASRDGDKWFYID